MNDDSFFSSSGSSPTGMSIDEQQALAERISRHAAPAQVKVDPDRARLELIKLSLRKLLALPKHLLTPADKEFLCAIGVAVEEK